MSTLQLDINYFLEQDLNARKGTNTQESVILRDLKRLYVMYAIALDAAELSVKEAILISEALAEEKIKPEQAMSIWEKVETACQTEDLHKQWEVEDYKPLVEKMKTFSLTQNMAIVDAVECFWLNNDYSAGGIYDIAAKIFHCPYEPCPLEVQMAKEKETNNE